MMRVSRLEELQLSTARPGLHLRAKIGFRRDGRITAMDLFIVQDNGPHAKQGDRQMCAACATANYTPLNFRARVIAVLSNTPPRIAQRGPGGVQQTLLLEPLISQAARELGIDQVEIRKINAPTTGDEWGPPECRGSARPLVERSCSRGTRQGCRAIQLGGADPAERPTTWQHRHGRRGRRWELLRWHAWLRRPDDAAARWEAVHPAGHRKPRDVVGVRYGARRGGSGRHAMGEGRHYLGQHVRASAF